MLVPAHPFETQMVATGVVTIVLSITGITAAVVYLVVVIIFMILRGLFSCVGSMCARPSAPDSTVGVTDLEDQRSMVSSFATITNVD